ncbi:MAG TPA: hypothetical protein PKH54_00555 [Myxococcota bacterium]|nr:hypothetical protein [Myxococcota bacterium]HOA13817.1 hypothetical protein [Myxococcota bacterium]HOC98404.1 hypothetical protein [Myxococcota bacterium]HOH76920.1 hypothetical protein [Myxococcota bacterium]HPV03093.1 hypothetical protein [Myxococcota bacterium]
MRRVFNWIVFGALAGVAVATAFAPVVLRTLLASTGAKDAMCQCVELVDNTARLLIKTQVWGLVIGAVLFPIAAWAIRRAWNKRRAARAIPTQTTPEQQNTK